MIRDFRVGVALLVLLIAASAHAQLTRGFISGTVEDQSAALVEGVAVTITNTQTGIKRDGATNEVGVYRFVGVEPGDYIVEFVKSGFETVKVGPLELSSAQEIVLNQTLKISGVSTAVEVQATPPGVELQKSTPTIDSTLSGTMVRDLPTTAFARDVTRLTLLSPTAVRVTGSGGEIAVNGQRARNNNWTIDGVDNNDVSITNVATRVIPELVNEFKVQTNAYSAEFGRSSGAQVAVTTRSGTNEYHGEVFDYYAANWMQPLSLPQKRIPITSTPRFNQNQAGGDVGGPIKHNRTFFFALLETNRERQAADPNNATNITIPTPQGYAALSSVPLGDNQTPQSRQSALGALNFLPEIQNQITSYQNLRNVTINGVPVQVGTARIPLAQPNDYWYIAGRVDHQLTARDMLSYRNTFDKRLDYNVISNRGFGTRWDGNQTIMAQSHALSETHTFGPALINEFRFSYSRRNLNFPENDPVTATTTITGYFTIGGTNTFPQGRIQNLFQYQDVLTWTRGRHSLKYGADFRRLRFYNIQGFNTKGTWTFDTLADFVNSNPSNFQVAVTTSTIDMRQNLMAYFFQDDFKISKDLTLNLGLRYEYNSYPFDLLGATQPEALAVGVPGPAVPDRNNWAPRGGIAYSPTVKDGLLHKLLGDGQTVFRGGYGIGYDVYYLNLETNMASNYPRVATANVFLPDTANLYPNQPRPSNVAAVLNPLAQFINADPHTELPTTHFYSFTIQREFGRGNVFEIGYSGNRSYHQIRQNELNYGVLTPAQAAINIAAGSTSRDPGVQARRLNPAWGSRLMIPTDSNSLYNALIVRFDKRLSRGLTMGANYTWSKFMADNDEPLAVTDLSDSSPPVPQDYRNKRAEWAPSAFDRTNRLVAYYDYSTAWFQRGPLNNAVLRTAFKDWNLAGFTEFQSGQPFTIRTGVDSLGNGRTDASRPDLNPNGILTPDPVYGNFRTFTTPLDGRGRFVTPLTTNGTPLAFSEPVGGNLGRNTFRGPYFTHWNLNFGKTFAIGDRFRVRFRNDIINLFNHRNFGPPDNRMSAPTFGQNIRNQVGDLGRTMLMSVKVVF